MNIDIAAPATFPEEPSSLLVVIDGVCYRLIMTCSVCPEQYEVYLSSGEQVGYLRNRWQTFTVSYPDVAGGVVHRARSRGYGEFRDTERKAQLINAVAAIHQHRTGGQAIQVTMESELT